MLHLAEALSLCTRSSFVQILRDDGVLIGFANGAFVHLGAHVIVVFVSHDMCTCRAGVQEHVRFRKLDHPTVRLMHATIGKAEKESR
ncbi:MAG: hypothetical protein ACRD2I_20765 [Vicinamibacterales bacterium]